MPSDAPRAESDAERLAAIRKSIARANEEQPWSPLNDTNNVASFLLRLLSERDAALAEREAEIRRLREDNLQWSEIAGMVQQALDSERGSAIPPMNFDTAVRNIKRERDGARAELARLRAPSADVIYEAEQAFKTDKTYTRDGHIQRIGATALRAAEALVVKEFLDCARYDALMEGPKFKGWNLSSLNRLREKYERIRALKTPEPTP